MSKFPTLFGVFLLLLINSFLFQIEQDLTALIKITAVGKIYLCKGYNDPPGTIIPPMSKDEKSGDKP